MAAPTLSRSGSSRRSTVQSSRTSAGDSSGASGGGGPDGSDSDWTGYSGSDWTFETDSDDDSSSGDEGRGHASARVAPRPQLPSEDPATDASPDAPLVPRGPSRDGKRGPPGKPPLGTKASSGRGSASGRRPRPSPVVAATAAAGPGAAAGSESDRVAGSVHSRRRHVRAGSLGSRSSGRSHSPGASPVPSTEPPELPAPGSRQGARSTPTRRKVRSKRSSGARSVTATGSSPGRAGSESQVAESEAGTATPGGTDTDGDRARDGDDAARFEGRRKEDLVPKGRSSVASPAAISKATQEKRLGTVFMDTNPFLTLEMDPGLLYHERMGSGRFKASGLLDAGGIGGLKARPGGELPRPNTKPVRRADKERKAKEAAAAAERAEAASVASGTSGGDGTGSDMGSTSSFLARGLGKLKRGAMKGLKVDPDAPVIGAAHGPLRSPLASPAGSTTSAGSARSFASGALSRGRAAMSSVRRKAAMAITPTSSAKPSAAVQSAAAGFAAAVGAPAAAAPKTGMLAKLKARAGVGAASEASSGGKSGAYAACRWEGDLLKGTPHGHGVLFVQGSEQARCECSMVDGIVHGLGIYSSDAGFRYAGEFRHGRPHGVGHAVFRHAELYFGEWREGERHGHGLAVACDGSLVRGTWTHNTQDAPLVSPAPGTSSAMLTLESNFSPSSPGGFAKEDIVSHSRRRRYQVGHSRTYGVRADHRVYVPDVTPVMAVRLGIRKALREYGALLPRLRETRDKALTARIETARQARRDAIDPDVYRATKEGQRRTKNIVDVAEEEKFQAGRIIEDEMIGTGIIKASLVSTQRRVAELLPEAKRLEAEIEEGVQQQRVARASRREANDLLREVERFRSRLAGLGVRESLVDGTEDLPGKR